MRTTNGDFAPRTPNAWARRARFCLGGLFGGARLCPPSYVDCQASVVQQPTPPQMLLRVGSCDVRQPHLKTPSC